MSVIDVDSTDPAVLAAITALYVACPKCCLDLSGDLTSDRHLISHMSLAAAVGHPLCMSIISGLLYLTKEEREVVVYCRDCGGSGIVGGQKTDYDEDGTPYQVDNNDICESCNGSGYRS